jgi:hypothetical protein
MVMNGSALSNETFVKIRWGWITLLLGQFILTAAFLIVTAVVTNQMKGQVLKSSAIALLLALGDDCRSIMGGIESVPAMMRKARVLQVKLHDDTVLPSGTSPDRINSQREAIQAREQKVDVSRITTFLPKRSSSRFQGSKFSIFRRS